MDAKRYRQIRQLFDAVMEQPAEQRSAYLAEAGKDDTALREEVERLLAASEGHTELFGHPATVRYGPGPLQRWEGRRVGPYQILRELGEGGMGIVYLARRADGAFQKEVAIKIVRRQLATPQFFQRFQREREILAKLEHPHIARLLDGGISPPFLVMEYVKGEPLLAYADSRKLTYDARIALLRQVASAVDYAHRQGVIHRDLKPANIFVTADGEVKLLDFGIAAWQQGEGESEISPTLAMSPAYASPEQVRGDKTNSATDIYSLGLVAYELLAGLQPFRFEEAAMDEVFRTVLEQTPPAPSLAVRHSKAPSPAELSEQRQMAPVELMQRLQQADAALLQALAKRREERPPTGADLIAGLGTGAPLPEEPSAWIRKLVAQWDFLAIQVAFLALLAGKEIRLTALAWFVYGWLTVVAILSRCGILRRVYGLSPTFTLATGIFTLVLGAGIVAGTRQELARKVDIGMLIMAGFFAFDVARYYLRRTAALGDRILAPKGRNFGSFWAGIFIMAAARFAFEYFSHGPANRVMALNLYTAASWICWKLSLKPLEVREKGLVVPTALLPWSSIRSYSWFKPTLLELQLHSTIWRPVSYVRAQVDPHDRDRVHHLLRDWLLEVPAPTWSYLPDDEDESPSPRSD